eukprot:m.21183 g.21183  ORF g.21183 m.21183 type:complete len:142 (+) comp7068_c0_seq1:1-426(+)
MMKQSAPMLEKMQQQGGPSGGPSGPGMDQEGMMKMAEEMRKDPKMMETMTNMMSSMDPKTLAAMSKQAGMNMSEEQAEQVTEKMKNLTPEQMQKMMSMSQKLMQVMQFLKYLRDLFFGTYMKAAASVAMLALFIAWLFGYA